MLTIDLIPVIEIGYNNQGITAPHKYPYWEHPEIWNAYHQECFEKAGFKDKLTPYLKGSSFFKPSEITDNNLTKLTIDHTQEMRDGKYERQQAATFFGGYVLNINGKDKYFPQCCGGLSDIVYWDSLSTQQKTYYEGHPAPQIKFDGDNVIFDFLVDEFDGPFEPAPSEITLSVDRYELKKAVEKAKTALQSFEKRLDKINEAEKLNIENIGKLLIWGDDNQEIKL
ncbi:hypothetical protein [Pedobacter sp. UBA5917]|jgi:hypothetical protein|uniref:hypothetical protein n=1 Tax=Pedobacter sp. UBA5917 TaxID=1947061 RepID=UPI0025F31CEF|nr:hypothetical protein [Pedobacter sp. UBA5917]